MRTSCLDFMVQLPSAVDFIHRLRSAHVVAACVAASLTSACSSDSFRFYDVVRTVSDLCDIRPEGEFCDPEQVPAPETIGWAVERQGKRVRIIVEEETWDAVANVDEPNKLTANKTEVITDDVGPCSTTRVRSIATTDDAATITGTMKELLRIEGVDQCGSTPRGERVSYAIEGPYLGSP